MAALYVHSSCRSARMAVHVSFPKVSASGFGTAVGSGRVNGQTPPQAARNPCHLACRMLARTGGTMISVLVQYWFAETC